jgi:hypothetical protein
MRAAAVDFDAGGAACSTEDPIAFYLYNQGPDWILYMYRGT